MTTYSKETALYNTGAIATDIDTAGTSATNYFTDISSGGVFVHEEDPTQPLPDASTSNGVKITNQVDIIREGESVASYGSGVRIGKITSGHSSIIMDPEEDSSSDISNIFQIKTSNDVFAQKIILDSNYTSSIPIWKGYSDDAYSMDGIGSSDDPITTTIRSTSESFILPDLNNIPNGTQFFITIMFDPRCDEYGAVTGVSPHMFTKTSTGSAVVSTEDHDFNSSDYPEFISHSTLKTTINVTYTPPDNIDIEFSARLSSPNIRNYWIPSINITQLVYTLTDVKIPIHQLYGDVYVCNALDISETYSPKGNFYIGLNNNDDVAYQLSQYYSISPIPVIKNSSLDVKKFFTDVAKTMVDTKNIKSKLKFYIETITPSGYNFTANQYRSLTSSNVPTHLGFTPLIVEARCTNKSALHVFNYTLINDGGTLSYEVVNRTSSAVNGANFSFKILYIRDDFIG